MMGAFLLNARFRSSHPPRGAAQRATVAGSVLGGFVALALSIPASPSPPSTGVPAQRALLDRYCVQCHSGRKPQGEFSLTTLDVGHPERRADQWEKVLVKLRAGQMPPFGAPRPAGAALRDLATAVEERIDRVASAHPAPRPPLLHRLNRTEYGNAVRDILNVDVDVTPLLPADDMSHGFDNMSEVLNVSPTLLAGYVRAAGKISRAALGDPRATPGDEVYHLPSTLNQAQHIEGTPFGTRGGIAIRHNFPADGEYVLKATLYFTTNALLFGSTQTGEQIEFAVNGERVALVPVNPRMKVDDVLVTPPVKIRAGPQTVTVAFVQKAYGPVEDLVQPFDHSLGDLFLGRTPGLTGLPHLRDVTINGPHHPTGVSDTPSRLKLLVSHPASPAEELPAGRKTLARLARLAYRRPVTEADLTDLVRVFQLGRQRGSYDDGIRLGVQFIVANPQFVFRFERTPPGVKPGAVYRISDLELASRLAFFLWSSGPDDELITLGSRGKLQDPAVLEHQVRRMLHDPRSEALARNFAGEWLHLRNLSEIQPDLFAYPNASANLLQSMRRETELFFWNALRENRPVSELLSADYTFVNEPLARLYGIADIAGDHFRRVPLPDPNRRGLLGQASILTVTSYANRTSPVVRGKWVLDNLLGAPPPKQPANVPPLKEIKDGETPVSVRARLEEHRTNPACASCHTLMDPIGFSLENFDAIGAWRIRDNGFKIDPRGTLVDGTRLDSPRSLQKALAGHADAFYTTFTQKLLTYALGRGIDSADMPAVRSILHDAARQEFRSVSFVLGIVKSAPFQMRVAAKDRAPRTVVAARP